MNPPILGLFVRSAVLSETDLPSLSPTRTPDQDSSGITPRFTEELLTELRINLWRWSKINLVCEKNIVDSVGVRGFRFGSVFNRVGT